VKKQIPVRKIKIYKLDIDRTHSLQPQYETPRGKIYLGDAEELLLKGPLIEYKGNVQLILTSPPFPLNRKKKYGNLTGQAYIQWLQKMAPICRDYLKPDGSIVLELGNAWERGKPVMSTLPIKALLAFLDAGQLQLCQEFVYYNPARLPTPAQWVTVERIRVKDAFTRVWWMSPSPRPKGNNRKVLKRYSKSMENLLKRGTYNTGKRPSEHNIGQKSFLKNNHGAIPPNVLIASDPEKFEPINLLSYANTATNDPYQVYCRSKGIVPHPARMQAKLAEFFIEFLTDEEDLVMDPFAGSNTTGAVAEKLQRNWLSIELEGSYIDASKARFNMI
jgi:DNA modification methylase